MNTVRASRTLCFLAFAAACAAPALLTGCGGASKAKISGKVTYKGEAVKGGLLYLHPESGNAYPVSINSDGTFSAGDAPVGPMVVTVESTGAAALPPGAPPGAGGSGTPGMTPPKDVQMPTMAPSTPIPGKYKDAKTSGLTWELKVGSNTKDFELTD